MGVWGIVAMQRLIMTLSQTEQAVGEVDQTVRRKQKTPMTFVQLRFL